MRDPTHVMNPQLYTLQTVKTIGIGQLLVHSFIWLESEKRKLPHLGRMELKSLFLTVNTYSI